MNKQEYIETLRYYLSSLPEDEQSELLRDYEAHFVHGLQQGRTEAEIISELGNPAELAREAIGSDFLPPPPKPRARPDMARLISVSILLFFLNIMFAIPIIASIWAVFISLCATAVACLLSPVALILETVIYNGYEPHKLFVMIGMIGFGMLLAGLSRHLGKWLILATTNYGKWNYKTWRGRD